VTLQGSVRTFQPETKERIKERFLQEYPGAYFRLGTAEWNAKEEEEEEKKQLHHPRFDIDEAALTIGMELMAQIAIDTLYELIGERK
jgi:metal-dependent amidase/aminoacylase/carboxypeptidase family protein